jgi:hypothetical protein
MPRNIVYASPWIDEDSDDSITHRIIAHVPEFDTAYQRGLSSKRDTYGIPASESLKRYATHTELIDGSLTAGQYDLTKHQALLSAARRYRMMK